MGFLLLLEYLWEFNRKVISCDCFLFFFFFRLFSNPISVEYLTKISLWVHVVNLFPGCLCCMTVGLQLNRNIKRVVFEEIESIITIVHYLLIYIQLCFFFYLFSFFQIASRINTPIFIFYCFIITTIFIFFCFIITLIFILNSLTSFHARLISWFLTIVIL